jgi:hypothetical protein
MDAKLPEDAVSVSDGGLEGDSELCGDLFAGETRNEELYDIHFAVGKGKHVCRARRTGVGHKFSPFQAQRSGLSWDYFIQYTADRPE